MSAQPISGAQPQELKRGWARPAQGGTRCFKAHYFRRSLFGHVGTYVAHCGLSVRTGFPRAMLLVGNFPHCKRCEAILRKRAET